ncbi:MAG: response regulator transcription factor [Pirellulaceae bacterium]|jgi:two-component system OmpR family response regulator/two-component system response regulator RstA|nr:response regulator transcription factor [Pirellulaceae bacterium]
MHERPAAFRILLVEDDAPLASMVADFLRPHGFDVAIEPRGDAAQERIAREQPDAVVLDVNLPGLDGFSLCQAVRASYRGAILMLTARGEELDEVLGLEAGADDYMAKPVRPRALLARLRSHLRRATPAEETSLPIRVGGLVVDAARRVVELDGQPVELTTAEFDVLYLLAQQAGRPLSRRQLYEHIHGVGFDILDRSIDLRISRLRRKLDDDPARPQRIKSVRGVGYLLSVES